MCRFRKCYARSTSPFWRGDWSWRLIWGDGDVFTTGGFGFFGEKLWPFEKFHVTAGNEVSPEGGQGDHFLMTSHDKVGSCYVLLLLFAALLNESKW
jgi:hypothetical protein